MGLFTEVLLLPLAPVRGVLWVASQMADMAEQELHDPSVVRGQLVALNEALEAGVISQEEFEREEERLLDLLEEKPPAPRTHANRPGSS
ncbi:gas vesicle protein GvpG [Streptomyces sp. 8N706]|uniref:gas vesicle protein GvpG n=1 Tax=Streptomyces sp. 8N706 TaxID=3457416 RepID=UPI003FCEEF57